MKIEARRNIGGARICPSRIDTTKLCKRHDVCVYLNSYESGRLPAPKVLYSIPFALLVDRYNSSIILMVANNSKGLQRPMYIRKIDSDQAREVKRTIGSESCTPVRGDLISMREFPR